MRKGLKKELRISSESSEHVRKKPDSWRTRKMESLDMGPEECTDKGHREKMHSWSRRLAVKKTRSRYRPPSPAKQDATGRPQVRNGD